MGIKTDNSDNSETLKDVLKRIEELEKENTETNGDELELRIDCFLEIYQSLIDE